MKVAVCQLQSIVDDVDANTETIIETMKNTDADLIIFPEMYLTGYVFSDESVNYVESALRRITEYASSLNKAVIVGAPIVLDDGMYNCGFLLDGNTKAYKKIHLPGFGIFNENLKFKPGKSIFVFDYKGFRFGLVICYDIFFPEQMKLCSMEGADVNICISASPISSKNAFLRVLPARAVENTTYVVFCNNIGLQKDIEFFGGSSVYSPTGELIASCNNDEIITFDIDIDVITSSRKNRPVLKDTVPL